VNKRDLKEELRDAERTIRRLANESFDLARECARLDAAIAERDAKIEKLLDVLTIATRSAAQNVETESNQPEG
jgi:hypothetical protein